MQPLLDIFAYLERGGPLMGPILLVSLLLWCLILFQLRQLWMVSRRDAGLPEALAAIRGEASLEKLSGTLLCRLVDRFVRIRGENRQDNAALLSALVAREEAYLGRYISYIFVLASIAPLLGLLGTVQGMISTFDVISVFGTGNPRALANGISEALITTQSGLLVSIPGLFMAGFLRRRVARLGQRLDEFKAGVLQVM